MSDQRRFRQDLRQGLTQFTMQMYQSYLEGHSEDEAKKLTGEAIQEQLGLFIESSASDSLRELFDKKLIEIVQQAEKSTDFDEQTYLEHQHGILIEAMEILDLKK